MSLIDPQGKNKEIIRLNLKVQIEAVKVAVPVMVVGKEKGIMESFKKTYLRGSQTEI